MWVMCGMVRMSEWAQDMDWGSGTNLNLSTAILYYEYGAGSPFFHSRPSRARRESWRRGAEWFLASASCVSCTHIMKMDISVSFRERSIFILFTNPLEGATFFANISSITNSSHSQASLRSVIILQTDYKSFARVNLNVLKFIGAFVFFLSKSMLKSHNVDRSRSEKPQFNFRAHLGIAMKKWVKDWINIYNTAACQM